MHGVRFDASNHCAFSYLYTVWIYDFIYSLAILFKSQDLKILNTFFMDSVRKFVLVHPSKKDPGQLYLNVYETQLQKSSKKKIRTIADLLLPISNANLNRLAEKSSNSSSLIYSKSISLHDSSLKSDRSPYIKQIESRTFDEESYFRAHGPPAENVKEAFVCVNLDEMSLQTFLFQMTDMGWSSSSSAALLNDNDETFQIKPLYKLNMSSIQCISSSPMIRGECALLSSSGSIYLVNEQVFDRLMDNFIYDEQSIASTRVMRAASDLSPLFDSKKLSTWRNVSFGAQPRELLYSDYTQVLSIDARIRSSSARSMSRELFSVANRHGSIEADELISRVQLLENDYNSMLIACTRTLLLVDQRYTKRALLEWKQHLKAPTVYMSTLLLADEATTPSTNASSSSSCTHAAICSDSQDIYAHHFSTKLHVAPVSHGYTRKLDTAKDMIAYLPSDYAKMLQRHINFRLNKPIVGLGSIRYGNSFGLFQVRLDPTI
jgi:hypothetical protein